jgi:hypothetical protein
MEILVDYWFLFLPLAIVLGFALLVITVCVIEKRTANEDAYDEEYKFCGVGKHVGNSVIRVRYDFWLSPDRLTVAVVGGGTTMKVPVNGIWLWSRLTDGTILCTCNEIGEQDISGLVQQQTWPQERFPRLVDHHALRLQDSETEPVPFEEGNPFGGLADLSRRRVESLVLRGRARYLDDENTRWKLTLMGAVQFYFTSVWIRPFRRLLRSLGIAREG